MSGATTVWRVESAHKNCAHLIVPSGTDGDSTTIARFCGPNAKSDAEYVAHAASCHDILVQAVSALQSNLQRVVVNKDLSCLPILERIASHALALSAGQSSSACAKPKDQISEFHAFLNEAGWWILDSGNEYVGVDLGLLCRIGGSPGLFSFRRFFGGAAGDVVFETDDFNKACAYANDPFSFSRFTKDAGDLG